MASITRQLPLRTDPEHLLRPRRAGVRGRVFGLLHCLDAQTGTEYWVHDLKAQTLCPPYWVDGKVYLGDESGKVTVFLHGKEKKVLAVNGNVRGWKVEWTSPVAANGVLYLVTLNPCRLWAIANK